MNRVNQIRSDLIATLIAKIQEEIWMSMMIVNVKKLTKENNVKKNVQKKLATNLVTTMQMPVNVHIIKNLGIQIHPLAIVQTTIPEITAKI